ncbi:hypothetical protein ABZ297_07590 [Nonomuraea sp. NPDC005983]|uniref:hypothetical protein n=1 Tax=Nonomuraea sp. NPDC005983 TaxID=3155595 RepID=UPI0033B1F195
MKGFVMRFSSVIRTSAAGFVVMVMALGLAACGGSEKGDSAASGVDKASLVEKMKTEPDVKGVPDAAISCMADVALKYADKKSLQDYVDGSLKSMDDIKGLGKENKDAEQAGWKCAE